MESKNVAVLPAMIPQAQEAGISPKKRKSSLLGLIVCSKNVMFFLLLNATE